MSCDPLVTDDDRVVGYVCRPSIEWLYRPDTACPVCGYAAGLVGMAQEWYGTMWTCLACGDQWEGDELAERPFVRGWRRRNVEWATEHVEGARVISEPTPAPSATGQENEHG